MDAGELDENWKRACRSDELARRFPEPRDSVGLVGHVLSRVRGGNQPPDPILSGAAAGFASSEYEVSGEAKYVQLAMLVMEAAKDPGADHRAALHVLSVIGQAAASLLVNTWRGEAEIDDLTQLGNRRKMEAVVGALVAGRTRFAYASIDADGLKRINDIHGHVAGDAFLRELGQELAHHMADASGQAFRYGGDEFGVLLALPDDGPEGLTDLMVAVQARMEATGRSFSVGIAVWPTEDSDPSTIIGVADRRMYDQKQAKKSDESV